MKGPTLFVRHEKVAPVQVHIRGWNEKHLIIFGISTNLFQATYFHSDHEILTQTSSFPSQDHFKMTRISLKQPQKYEGDFILLYNNKT